MKSAVECPLKSSKYNEIRMRWKTNNGSENKIKSLIPRPVNKKTTKDNCNESSSLRIRNEVQEIHHLKVTQDIFPEMNVEPKRVELTRPIPNIESGLDLENNDIYLVQEYVLSDMTQEINVEENFNENFKKSEPISDPSPKLDEVITSEKTHTPFNISGAINNMPSNDNKENNGDFLPTNDSKKRKSNHIWDSRGKCKRCHVYKIGHKPRKGLMFMMRMSIGRICKQRLNKAWRKATDHFTPRLNLQRNTKNSEVMDYLQKSLVGMNDNMKRNSTRYEQIATEGANKLSTEIKSWSLIKPEASKNETERTQTSKRSLDYGRNPNVGPSMFPMINSLTGDKIQPFTKICSNSSIVKVTENVKASTDPLITYQDNDTQTTRSSKRTIGVFGMEQILLNEKSNYVTETTVPCRRLENTLVTGKGTILSCTGTRITSLSPVASVYHLQHAMDDVATNKMFNGFSAWFARKENEQNPTAVHRILCSLKDVCVEEQSLNTAASTSTSGLKMVRSVCMSDMFNNGRVAETNEVHCFTQYSDLSLLGHSRLMSVRMLDSMREMAIEAKPVLYDTEVDDCLFSKSAEVSTDTPVNADKSVLALALGIEKNTQYEVLGPTPAPVPCQESNNANTNPCLADFVISSNLNAQKWMKGYQNNADLTESMLNLSQITVNELLDRAFTISHSKNLPAKEMAKPQNAFSCVAMEQHEGSDLSKDGNSRKISDDNITNVSNVTTGRNNSTERKIQAPSIEVLTATKYGHVCQNQKSSRTLNSNASSLKIKLLSSTENAVDIRGTGKDHLKMVYFYLTAIEGRVKRLRERSLYMKCRKNPLDGVYTKV